MSDACCASGLFDFTADGEYVDNLVNDNIWSLVLRKKTKAQQLPRWPTVAEKQT